MKKSLINKRLHFKSSSLLLAFCFLCLSGTLSSGCKKFISVESPPTSINSNNTFANDATATATLTGIYAKMSVDNRTLGGLFAITKYAGLSADDFSFYNGNSDPVLNATYRNALTSTTNPDIWSSCYGYIYDANAAIDGLSSATTLTVSVKKQLLGEAYFMRAFCYFYLVNLYGDVPMVTSIDYAKTSTLPRVAKQEIYQKIIADLIQAQSLLSDKYLMGNVLTPYGVGQEERVRPTVYAANSLLARTYVYLNDFKNAEIQATSTINNKAIFDTVGVNDVFVKNSKETIWSIQPVGSNNQTNTGDGGFFIPNTPDFPTTTYSFYLSNNFLQAIEPSDKRFTSWLVGVTTGSNTYYYPFKYKIRRRFVATAEYSIIFRLGEQYLIRAEARANQNNLNGALSDLNLIRKRAGLNPSPAVSQPQILTAIARERRVELFSEWGHRWFDLKRTGTLDAVMSLVTPLKGGVWNSQQALYPIPSVEVQRDPKLVQNPGY